MTLPGRPPPPLFCVRGGGARAGRFQRASMSQHPFLPVIAVALLALPLLPARAQRGAAGLSRPARQGDLRRGAAAATTSIARVGYTPEGWRTVMRMMLNFDVPVPKDQVETLTNYLIASFPERDRQRRHRRRTGRGRNQSSGRCRRRARARTIRSPPGTAGSGTRADVRPPRRPQPQHWRGAGISARHRTDRSARACRGQVRQHLVHRQSREPRRQAQPQDRRDLRIQDAGSHGRIPHHRCRSGGTVWFTVQNGNMVGRLDPKSGAVQLATSPTPNSRPMGW